MKKLMLFAILAVILTACPTPEPCPECPEPTDTVSLTVFQSGIYEVPEGVGFIEFDLLCPDPEPCPEPHHVERLVLRDVKAGDRLGKPAEVEFFCLDSLIIESVVCPECPDCDTIPPDPDPDPDPDTTVYEGNAYVVAPNGSDSAPGTFEYPWRTWSRAFNASELNPGDTVYFRGGIYPHTAADGWDGITCEVDGELGAMIHFFNFPGEEPILDSKGMKVEWTHNRGLYMKGVNYVHFKGLTIQHVEQRDRGTIRGDIEATAWHFRGYDCIIEQCVVRNCHGGGIGLNNCDNVWVINCDGFNMVDSFTNVPAGNPMPGNDGTAFSDWNTNSTEYRNYFYGNRAWMCGDQGFTSGSIGYTEYVDNWSFNNGVLEGGGHGYKMGWIPTVGAPLNRLYRSNLAVNNRAYGWDTNEGSRPCGVLQTENNIAYGNRIGYRVLDSSSGVDQEQNRVYESNVAYANNTNFLVVSGAGVTEEGNSWNKQEQVNSGWFVSLDASQLMRPRKADGSLPDITFLNLTEEATQIMNW